MSGERIVPEKIASAGEYYLFLKEKFSYEKAAELMIAGQSCLDLGCGAGFGLPILKKVAGKVVGLDVDTVAVEVAKKNYASMDCSFCSYDGKTLPQKNAEFDWVVCLQVLEHVKAADKFIAEIKRVLKPGGGLVLTTPNRLSRLDEGMRPWNVFHCKEYSPQEVKTFLAGYFKEVKLFGIAVSPEIRQFEEKRVEANKKIARLDFLSLRHRLPRVFSAKLAAGLAFLRQGSKPLQENLELDSKAEKYFLQPDDFTGAFDIMAVCR